MYYVRRNEFYIAGKFIFNASDDYSEDERIDELKKKYLKILNDGEDNFRIHSLRIGYLDAHMEVLQSGKTRDVNMVLVDDVRKIVNELM